LVGLVKYYNLVSSSSSRGVSTIYILYCAVY